MGGTERPRVAAMAGNPNVGKSTVFNALTGLHQHTGNWAIKTGLMQGGGDGNYMWQDFLTREQLVTVLYRFAQMMGKA